MVDKWIITYAVPYHDDYKFSVRSIISRKSPEEWVMNADKPIIFAMKLEEEE